MSLLKKNQDYRIKVSWEKSRTPNTLIKKIKKKYRPKKLSTIFKALRKGSNNTPRTTDLIKLENTLIGHPKNRKCLNQKTGIKL